MRNWLFGCLLRQNQFVRLINDYIADNPEAPSFIETVPLFNYNGESI